MKYKTQGVCSREISFEVENNKLKNVKFVGEIGRASCRERV